MFQEGQYNNSPAHYSQDIKSTIPYYTPITYIKGNKTITPSGKAIMPKVSQQEQYIYNFIIQKASNYNTITFSKDLYLKYKGYLAQYVYKPSPGAKGHAHESYTLFKRGIISLLKAHLLLKPYPSKRWFMVNPAYAHSGYRGIPKLASEFGKEYGYLTNNELLTEANLRDMCDNYIKEAETKVKWCYPKHLK